MAARGGDVTVISLDSITRLEARRSKSWLRGQNLLVTTTDGAQYQFGVKLDRWSADIANALTARGCEVRTVPRGMAVTPGNTPSGWGDLPPSHHERGVR